MNKRMLLCAALPLVLVALTVGAALAQTSPSYDLWWHVLAGGGGYAESTSHAQHGTIGQALVGVASGGSYEFCTGFWCGAGGDYYTYLPLVLKQYP